MRLVPALPASFDSAYAPLRMLALLVEILMTAWVYILKCSDGSYYVGSTTNLERRLWEHQNGFYKGYTSSRLPVELVWSTDFPTEHDAFLFERQIKGWSRAKKEALIRGDWEGIHQIVKSERKEREAKKRSTLKNTQYPDQDKTESKD